MLISHLLDITCGNIREVLCDIEHSLLVKNFYFNSLNQLHMSKIVCDDAYAKVIVYYSYYLLHLYLFYFSFLVMKIKILVLTIV